MGRKTAIFTLGSTALFLVSWLIYDVWAISDGGTEASISFMIYEWSYKFPIFTWSVGFTMGLFTGHFFWRIRDTKRTLEISEDSRK